MTRLQHLLAMTCREILQFDQELCHGAWVEECRKEGSLNFFPYAENRFQGFLLPGEWRLFDGWYVWKCHLCFNSCGRLEKEIGKDRTILGCERCQPVKRLYLRKQGELELPWAWVDNKSHLGAWECPFCKEMTDYSIERVPKDESSYTCTCGKRFAFSWDTCPDGEGGSNLVLAIERELR